MKRTRTEYRITIKRAGREPRVVRRFSEGTLRRYLTLLGPEPWRAYAPDSEGGDYVCCPGTRYDECGCGGITHSEQSAEKRKAWAPIQWIRIEARVRKWELTPWDRTPLLPDTENALRAIECKPDEPDAKYDAFDLSTLTTGDAPERGEDRP
jgi:hypothetical protein